MHAVVLRWQLDGRKFLAFNDQFDLVGIKHFALQQCIGDPRKHVAAVGEQRLRSAVALVDQAPHFQIDFDRGVFAVVAMLGNLAAQEDLLFFFAKCERAERAHAPFAHHLAGEFGGALDVVAGAGAHLVQEQLFGETPTHQDRNLGLEVFLGVVVLVVDRKLHGHA